MRNVNRELFAVGTLALVLACTQTETVSPTAQLLSTGATVAVGVTTTGTLTTANSDIDADGYVAWLDYSTAQPVATNGLVTFSGVGPGSNGEHTVALYGIASNCAVSTLDKGANNPRTVSVIEGTAASTEFSIGCAASGGLTIRTSTSGVDLPAGYTVTVGGRSRAIAPNAIVTFTEVFEGEQTVTLSDVAANCELAAANPGTVTIVPGTTAQTTFSATCAQTGSGTGSLTVTTVTSGSDLPPEYTVTVDGTLPQAIGANASVTVAVPAGANWIELSAVPSNCTAAGENPRTVSVPADGASGSTFEIVCETPQPRVTGDGQLGTAAGQAQLMGFDLRADLTGRFAISDQSNIHPSGNPASLFTDASRDPETSILAYRNSSNACADPSRGAEFDAIGREDEGPLRFYTVQLCDNGPAGSGTDFFSFFIPAEGYGRSGVVTSGDVAKK